ncbi:Brisc complex subunit abro1-like protein [Thalictrum thalictroides]|uniref:Brisc complex subunit abro1-like protein n=1 Tax=Thalictrum thalictroides TaxID=46969 RepID=A0A7J6WS46_THATH|nr:Brisc complex subunit abro1-like protein [Thalictrum thalictroides]
MDNDLPLEKIAISGPTLASLIQRFSSSNGDVDGLLFGHVTQPTPANLLDDDFPSSSSISSSIRSDSPTLVANITSFFCSGTLSSFYDSLGQLNISALNRCSLGNGKDDQQQRLIGWFVGRRRTPLRPSMREFSVSSSLSSKTLETLNFSQNESISISPFPNFPPCVFLLLSSPLSDQLIHTHDYRAFQFRRSSEVFEPKSIDVINIGPAFRGHYGAFSPNSQFPWLSCAMKDFSSSPSREMEIVSEDDKGKEESLLSLKKIAKEQRGLDSCAEGFEVGRLSKLVGSEAVNYTLEVEDLYGKMLAKLEGLARLVEKSSALVLEQERCNIKLRNKVSGLE